ncbi:MAG TPA: polyprenol monophosphomannose synthase [Chloroflexota bacterium]|nr:polyprenol monophosphomannose synthase [Chloroflexota bacterium]
MRIIVVVPTYNELENLPELITRVEKLPTQLDFLIVDDNSPDGTGELADRLAADRPWLRVLHRPGKAGLGTAYREGFRYALGQGYDAVGEMDADLSHDPTYLPSMIQALQNADLVLGSRYVRGGGVRNWGMMRKIISRGGSLYSQLILGLPVHDLTGGFKLFRRQLLERMDLDRVRSNGYSFQIEMTYRALRLGCRVVEVPIVFVDRRVGRSKLSRQVMVEAMLMVPRLRLGKL